MASSIAPFGASTERFCALGIHPKRLLPGTFLSSNRLCEVNCSVGQYDINGRDDFHPQILQKKSKTPGWARQAQTEKMAKIPHLLYREQWEKREFMKTNLGPGHYDILNEQYDKPRSTKGIIETLSPRFPKSNRFITPGPGRYGEGGIPNAAVQAKEKESASRVGLMDAASGTSRSLPQVGSLLPPGHYETKGMVEMLEAKKCGNRGPYDIFSLDRNKPIITGHYAHMKGFNLGPGQYSFKSGVDKMQHDTENTKKGRFSTYSQYPRLPTERVVVTSNTALPKPASFPSPAHYDPPVPGDWPKPEHNVDHAPFGGCAPRFDRRSMQFFTKNYNSVGPGRNDLHKWEETRYVNAHTNNFKSSVPRDMAIDRENVLRERLRPRNLKQPPSSA